MYRNSMTSRRWSLSLFIFMLLSLSLVMNGTAQEMYRTFTQDQLGLKKARAGKAIASRVTFTFENTTNFPVHGIRIRFNDRITVLEDSGSFQNVSIEAKGKILTATCDIPAKSSTSITGLFDNRKPGTMVSSWYWRRDGRKYGITHTKLAADFDERIYVQPNGGNVLYHLYKNILRRPTGLVIGIPTDERKPEYGWVRFLKADKKFFTNRGTARCLTSITLGSGTERIIRGEVKNLTVKKHDNHLLGELHALKLAITANDVGFTEPLTDATAFGDLIYNDTTNPDHPLNGRTIREIVGRADSALSFCEFFDISMYEILDSTITSLNRAFWGEITALTFAPLVVSGARSLNEIVFLQRNPRAPKITVRRWYVERIEPETSTLEQNYPNPFNPATTIPFSLLEPSIVTVKVYNTLGQTVATLVDGEQYDEGDQTVSFVADNLTSGIYFYTLNARGIGEGRPAVSTTRRMLLLK